MFFKNTIKFKVIVIIIIASFLPAFSEVNTAEVLGIRSENGSLLIDVAKRYPEIKFSLINNTGNVLIELVNSKYHKNFNIDTFNFNKIYLLDDLDFLNDIEINLSKKESTSNLGISLGLKQGVNLFPKLVSTKNNTIKISLLSKTNNDLVIDKNAEIYNKAVEEHKNKNYDLAEKLYSEVLLKDGNYFLARYNLAKLYADKEIYDDAIVLLNKLIEELKNQPQSNQNIENLIFTYIALGNVYLLKNDLDNSLRVFKEINELNPSLSQVYFYLGLISEKKKDLNEAKINFLKAVELKPDFADSYYHLGIIDLINKDKKGAISYFKRVIEFVPDTKLAELSQNEINKLKK